MTLGTRRIGLIVAGLAVAGVALNVVGVIRYPGGPLRELSADGPLWLDTRPADQGSNAIGNSLPSDWAVAGQTYVLGTLVIHNATGFSATIEAVTPLDPTPGLTLDAVWVRRPTSVTGNLIGFGPSSMGPDAATFQRDFLRLPATIPGGADGSDTQVILVLGSGPPGAFGFSALAVDYRVGPFTFHAVQHLALAGCLGPLPAGVSCPTED